MKYILNVDTENFVLAAKAIEAHKRNPDSEIFGIEFLQTGQSFSSKRNKTGYTVWEQGRKE